MTITGIAGDFVLQVVCRPHAWRTAGERHARHTWVATEFVAVLGEVGDSNGVRRALAALQAAVCEPVMWEGGRCQGRLLDRRRLLAEDADECDALMAAADAAMYRAKAEGRGRIVFYAESKGESNEHQGESGSVSSVLA